MGNFLPPQFLSKTLVFERDGLIVAAAARKLALLRKIALDLVVTDRSSQTSLRGRRKKAAWNDDYMLRIITRQAHA